MKILFIGDIFGKPGRIAILKGLPILRETHEPDVVIANGENVAGGFGITNNLADKLFRYGIDIITGGNHIWDRQEIDNLIESHTNVLRPINYPIGVPGNGSVLFETKKGGKIAVINAQGRIFMRPIDDPFRVAKKEAERLRGKADIILIDFHAEATSEKKAFGYFLDGIASAVVGTHTHVQTSDNQILPKGAAYITDAGMTGAHDSIIGVRKEQALKFVLFGRNVRFSPAEKDVRIQGCIIETDDATGKALTIERIDMPVDIKGG